MRERECRRRKLGVVVSICCWNKSALFALWLQLFSLYLHFALKSWRSPSKENPGGPRPTANSEEKVLLLSFLHLSSNALVRVLLFASAPSRSGSSGQRLAPPPSVPRSEPPALFRPRHEQLRAQGRPHTRQAQQQQQNELARPEPIGQSHLLP